MSSFITLRRCFATVLVLWASVQARAASPFEVHVSPQGDDTGLGTAARPFKTLERARDALRSRRASEGLPDGAEVRIYPGDYQVRQTFFLTAEDSGTETAPIVYRALGPVSPRFHGGVRLTNFRPLTDSAAASRVPENVRAQVWEADLTAAGITKVLPFELGGFSSGRGFSTHSAHELFIDGEPMTLARWPNEGFVKTGEALGPLSLPAYDQKKGTPEGRFRYEGDRPSRWTKEPDAWLYGYWFWDWADSYEKIERIDAAAREIFLAKPWHTYGYRRDQRYYAVNLLTELDAPGEWYLDRETRRVYLYPPRGCDLRTALVELSCLAQPLLETAGASWVRFQGLTWECGAGDGVRVRGGDSVRLEGCTIRKMAGNGVEFSAGKGHQLRACDLHTLGRGGVQLAGGDRKTLEPSGYRVENCHIHHLSRIDHTYTPGVHTDGVGHVIRNNLLHHIASSAMRIEGNDHLIERNEAHRVVLESDDQGAVDMFGNPTYRGNVYRHNYWHHLGNWDRRNAGDDAHTQRAGIRLDDAICGVVIEGNIFQRCSTGRTHFGGVQIHGGKDNRIEGNLFVDTGAGVSFTPWGEKRWKEFVAPALGAAAIDAALYQTRYPDLARLSEDHDVNTVRGNAALRCGPLFLRPPAGLRSSNNVEFAQGADLPEGPDGRLVWSAESATRLGVEAIPYARIGLEEDAWRYRENGEWLLRSEPVR